jgi:capsular exopolysaccharide synthesis family protein
MNDLNLEQNDGMEIDLKRLMDAVLGKAWLIGIVSLLMAVLTFVGTFLFVTPLYQSAAMFYVNNSDISVGNTTLSLTSSDISASRGLVDTYIVILGTRETLLDVIDYAEADLSYTKLKNMIQAEAVDDTEVFRVTITSPDPAQAEQLANAVAYILPKRISNIIEGTSAKVVDAAVIASRPSSPNYTKNTMLGFVLGLIIMATIVVVLELLDVTIRAEEDITHDCQHPILASVPDMVASGKGAPQYGYGRGTRKGESTENAAQERPVALYGSQIGFAASESYKLLRTKLQFSFTEDKGCRVIGITSAMVGEGKSLTSINLAYSLAELGKRVILLDADMRRPTLAEKLGLNKKPGLSSCLTGQGDLNNLIQRCNVSGDEKTFCVITAGQNPPNPAELLSSNKMNLVLDTLRKHYDYVIVDLPPVKEVSDSLAVADKLDGMLLVVRQNCCNRVDLGNTVRQLAFVNAKVLGIVFNGVSETVKGYGRKYYNRYDRGYGYYYHRTSKQEVKK